MTETFFSSLWSVAVMCQCSSVWWNSNIHLQEWWFLVFLPSMLRKVFENLIVSWMHVQYSFFLCLCLCLDSTCSVLNCTYFYSQRKNIFNWYFIGGPEYSMGNYRWAWGSVYEHRWGLRLVWYSKTFNSGCDTWHNLGQQTPQPL